MLLCVLIFCFAAIPVPKDGEPTDANTVKALFIYNFTKQIEWPLSSVSGTKFTISVLQNEELANSITEILKGRKIFDKLILVKNVSTAKEIIGSQILFIPKGKITKIRNELSSISENGLLIISEEKTLPAISSINLTEKNNQMRFELNLAAIKRQNLKTSNVLIKLAINS